MSDLQLLQVKAYNTAQAHGFTDASFGERIALIHSELSEALEAYRERGFKESTSFNTTGYSQAWDLESIREDLEAMGVVGKPEGVASELADAVIRILDTCEAFGINLERAIIEKMAYNDTREYRHGGKLL